MRSSFAYAADAGQWEQTEDGMEPGEVVRTSLEPFARNWQLWTAAVFLREYLDAVDPRLIPRSREDLAILLDVFLLEKAVYQLGHELRARPAWVGLPLRGPSAVAHRPLPDAGLVRHNETGINDPSGGEWHRTEDEMDEELDAVMRHDQTLHPQHGAPRSHLGRPKTTR